MSSEHAPTISPSTVAATAPSKPRAGRSVPGPRGPLSGLPLIRKPIPFIEKLFREYGDVVSARFLNFPVYIVAHPEGVKHVLQENHRNYTKSRDYVILARLLGQGLVTSEGSIWLAQRRLMQPMFHHQKIAAFGTTMTDCTLGMLDRWSGIAGRHEPVDVTSEMMRLTLEIVGRALLTMDLTSQADTIGRTMTTANERFGQFDIGMLAPWLPTPKNFRFRKAVGELRRIVLEIIANRRRENRDYGDLLSMLLAARDEETGAAMSDEQLRDEILTLILAGHETTANALSWTWYLLSQNPEAERKLHAELDEVLGGRPPAMADLGKLNYTGMVIDEALRIYPPVWSIGRAAIADDEIMGYRIPRGSNVMLSQWLTHRHPQFWENPERFEPERFSAERAAGRPRYAYFPFSGGPRQCIGNIFALTEAQLVLATIAQSYRLRLVPGHPIELQPLITLRPRYGVKMTLESARG
jgi:cytochrome P450